MHPYFAIRATEDHRRDLERNAERRRLALATVPPDESSPGLPHEGVRTRLGLALVGLGLRVAGPLRVPPVYGCRPGGTP